MTSFDFTPQATTKPIEAFSAVSRPMSLIETGASRWRTNSKRKTLNLMSNMLNQGRHPGHLCGNVQYVIMEVALICREAARLKEFCSGCTKVTDKVQNVPEGYGQRGEDPKLSCVNPELTKKEDKPDNERQKENGSLEGKGSPEEKNQQVQDNPRTETGLIEATQTTCHCWHRERDSQKWGTKSRKHSFPNETQYLSGKARLIFFLKQQIIKDKIKLTLQYVVTFIRETENLRRAGFNIRKGSVDRLD